MRGCSAFTARKKTSNAQRPTSNGRIGRVSLHFFGHFNAQQIETALQNAGGQIAKRQSRRAQSFFRFQNRTSLVEAVKAICELEQVIRENIWAETIQYLRNDFGELTKFFCQSDFRLFVQ